MKTEFNKKEHDSTVGFLRRLLASKKLETCAEFQRQFGNDFAAQCYDLKNEAEDLLISLTVENNF